MCETCKQIAGDICIKAGIAAEEEKVYTARSLANEAITALESRGGCQRCISIMRQFEREMEKYTRGVF